MTNIAIIGCGLIGETHATCLAKLGNPAAIYCDSDTSRADALVHRFGGRCTEDPLEALSDASIDAVYICTYHESHAPFAIDAAKLGKHIFLEKPMALRADDCASIVEAVTDAGVLCMTGFKFHYYSLVKKAKELVPNPIVLSAHVLDTRWPDDSWANDPLKGGGNVLSQGCHGVELLCNLAGSRPLRVYAEGGNLHHPKNDIIDSLVATVTFENGAVATLTVSDAGKMPRNSKFSVQALDGEKTVHLYDRLQQLSYFDGHEEQQFESEEDGFLNENREFLDALRQQRKPETSEQDGYRASMILLRAIESSRSHQPQSLLDL